MNEKHIHDYSHSLSHKAAVIGKSALGKDIFMLKLHSPQLSAQIKPGQFVMLAASDGIDPLLRRPFSVADIDSEAGSFSLIYNVTGKGTARMAAWEAGMQVDLLGPLGNGFRMDKVPKQALLVGGGMGIAALLPLAKALRAQAVAVSVFLGAKTADLLFGDDSFREYGCEVIKATEDGSSGTKGFVTLPLEKYLQDLSTAIDKENDAEIMYACGPNPFLSAVAALGAKYGIDTQISLEERMGCGFGACLGCTVQTKDAAGEIVQKRVCVDGPVFDAQEVVFHG